MSLLDNNFAVKLASPKSNERQKGELRQHVEELLRSTFIEMVRVGGYFA